MSKVVKSVVCLGLLIMVISLSYGNAKADKLSDIRQLIHMTGGGELGVQIINQMISQYRQTMPNVPAKFWDKFMQEINPEGLVELMVPIYDRHFTQQDITELIKFYQSPLGVKLIQKLPAITQESFQAGQEWGEKLGERVIEKLQAEGYQTRR